MRVREKMGGRKRERVGMCIWNFWLDRTPESRREKKKKTGREKAFSRTLLLVADVWTGSVQYDETRQHGAGQFRLTSYGRCSTLLVYSRVLRPLYTYILTQSPLIIVQYHILARTHTLFLFPPASHRAMYLHTCNHAFVKLRANLHPTFRRNRIHATFSSGGYIGCAEKIGRKLKDQNLEIEIKGGSFYRAYGIYFSGIFKRK